MTLDKPIAGFDQIAAIRNVLLGNGIRKVTVLNWRPFEDPA